MRLRDLTLPAGRYVPKFWTPRTHLSEELIQKLTPQENSHHVCESVRTGLGGPKVLSVIEQHLVWFEGAHQSECGDESDTRLLGFTGQIQAVAYLPGLVCQAAPPTSQQHVKDCDSGCEQDMQNI